METINLSNLSTLKTNDLWLIQKKWYKQQYELTDDAFVYGQIYNAKGWKQSTILRTDKGEFKICSSFSGKFTVKTIDDVELGSTSQKLFNRRITLTMNDGFKAVYYNPSIWKSRYVWEDEQGNEIMSIKYNGFSRKKAEFTFNRPAAQIPNFNILVLLAVKFLLMRQAAAIAASV